MVRLLALVATGALALVGCSMFQRSDPLQVTVLGVEPSQGEGLEARMDLKLRIQNPNDAPIEYNGVFVELDVQGKNLATGVSDKSGSLPAFGETIVTVPMTVSMVGIVGQAVGLFGGKSLDKIDYKMHGKLNSTSGTHRFESQGELSLSSLMGSGG